MVSIVNPTFDFLVPSPSAYVVGKEAVEVIFTDSFLKSMLKEAAQGVTLASSSAARDKARAVERRQATRFHPPEY